MKLETYMKLHSLTDDAMAEKIGKDRTMVGRYRRGEVVPPSEVIRDIQAVTNLAVQFNDWFSEPEKSGAAA
jgi:transcriptional regulator with XRE-family HTH domain